MENKTIKCPDCNDIKNLEIALYYGARETGGFGIEAKDEVIKNGIIALENGVTFNDTPYAVPISIECFIIACKKRKGFIERLDKVMGYDKKELKSK